MGAFGEIVQTHVDGRSAPLLFFVGAVAMIAILAVAQITSSSDETVAFDVPTSGPQDQLEQYDMAIHKTDQRVAQAKMAFVADSKRLAKIQQFMINLRKKMLLERNVVFSDLERSRKLKMLRRKLWSKQQHILLERRNLMQEQQRLRAETVELAQLGTAAQEVMEQPQAPEQELQQMQTGVMLTSGAPESVFLQNDAE